MNNKDKNICYVSLVVNKLTYVWFGVSQLLSFVFVEGTGFADLLGSF